MATATSAAIQIQDMRSIARAPWRHWSLFTPNTHEFLDPAGDRTVRVVCAERLEPGDGETIMSASYTPRHYNSYDVLMANLKLPLPGSGLDPVDPIGGALMLRPECLLAPGRQAMPKAPPADDHVQVNIYMHTDGPSGEPMVTVAEMAKITEQLERDHPGCVHADKGEFITPDGEIHELLEICWEKKEGRKFPFPDPARLGVALGLPVMAYPWLSAPGKPGVKVKPILNVSAGGPNMKLVKLDAGAQLDAVTLDAHRFIAVVAGALRDGDRTLGDLTVVYGPPGETLGELVADQPTLLWVVEWQPKAGPLSAAWKY